VAAEKAWLQEQSRHFVLPYVPGRIRAPAGPMWQDSSTRTFGDDLTGFGKAAVNFVPNTLESFFRAFGPTDFGFAKMNVSVDEQRGYVYGNGTIAVASVAIPVAKGIYSGRVSAPNRGALPAQEIVGPYSPIGARPEIVGPYSPIATGAPTQFVNGVVVVDRKSGTVFEGTVDLGPTLDRIQTGGSYPHRNDGSIFQNRPPVSGGGPLLPVQFKGYYTEYVLPTPGVKGPGPQRVVVGKGGDMYYTPDHYDTFIPVRK
jgi:guanyl-specific ribonuclease Sa